ncbi:alpha/beta hydrolase-fold protein [Aquimarina algiphila]|uniref:alpha/beta hydrolase-fold protein n=1 Tax=Aquimarina algiphila TaxID=2047982 RepID=UPI00232C0C80|nr:alpha/beta hydrolase-fold protein [Aquimarina algiphila]
MKNYILILLLSHISFYGQKNETENIFGKTFIFQSEILEEKTEIQIYLPENYNISTQKYPVLYVLDGQRYFLNGITYQKNLAHKNSSPSFIVVGIKTNTLGKRRRELLYKESKKFIRFIEKEIVPHVDNNYRTLNERVYFGWEMAASLGLEIFAKQPSLFNAFILSSPTYITKNRTDGVLELLKTKKQLNHTIYFSLGSVESWSFEGINTLAKIFEQHTVKGLKWKYKLLGNDNHYSTPLITINQGLKTIFQDFEPIRFYSLQEFEDFGGIIPLQQHYQKRGERYDLQTDIHNDTKHYLLLQSLKEDNYNLFTFFVKEFDAKVFWKNYHKNHFLFHRYAQYYLKHNNIDEAKEIYSIGLEKFPESSLLHKGKADIYKVIGNRYQAKKHYQKAIKIAKQESNPELLTYKKSLEELEQNIKK